MKVKSAYCWVTGDKLHSNATIDVPGLGEVKIDFVFSDETIKIIHAEAEAALRVKMGQVLKVNNEPDLFSA